MDGYYDPETGKLVLWDRDTPVKYVEVDAVSGGRPYGDPISAGKYEILEPRNGHYRLDAIDATPRNDIYESAGRSHLRLHNWGRGNNFGCISVKSNADWTIVNQLLQETKTVQTVDYFKPWWKFWQPPSAITKFGTISVP